MPKQPAKREVDFNFELFHLFLVLSTILILLFISLNLNSYLNKQPIETKENETEVLGVKDPLEEERAFWTDFLKNNPEYLPGWVELAKIEEKSGNFREFNNALNKVRSIDPNSDLLKTWKQLPSLNSSP